MNLAEGISQDDNSSDYRSNNDSFSGLRDLEDPGAHAPPSGTLTSPSIFSSHEFRRNSNPSNPLIPAGKTGPERRCPWPSVVPVCRCRVGPEHVWVGGGTEMGLAGCGKEVGRGGGGGGMEEQGTWASRRRKQSEAGPVDGGVWTAKTVKRPPQQSAQPPIRQLLGATDAQAAHPATSSTAPAHQRRGPANAETTPAGAPAAAADRTQRPDATREGQNG